jgi:hypothetical protein
VDVDVAVPLLLALLGLMGAFIHQWWAVILPLIAIPVFYAGVRYGWWGEGVGDGWEYGAAIVTVVGVLGSLVGLVVGRVAIRAFRH